MQEDCAITMAGTGPSRVNCVTPQRVARAFKHGCKGRDLGAGHMIPTLKRVGIEPVSARHALVFAAGIRAQIDAGGPALGLGWLNSNAKESRVRRWITYRWGRAGVRAFRRFIPGAAHRSKSVSRVWKSAKSLRNVALLWPDARCKARGNASGIGRILIGGRAKDGRCHNRGQE